MSGTPGHPSAASAPQRSAVLSKELADFLIELSIALHKHTMYPEGHPSLAPAAAGVTRRAEHLLEDRPTVALGVARQQLVIEGVATDPKNPLLSELAGRLHRHHLGAITFHRGVRVAEVTDVLRTLAVEATRSGEPLGLGPVENLRVWEHVRLHPVTYEKLELVTDVAADPLDERGGARSRAGQLWVGLARAALGSEDISEDDPRTKDSAALAKAIDEHPKSAAYDQVIVRYLLQISDELKNAGGAEAIALRRRTSKLVSSLERGTLRRLIEVGGDNAERVQFAIDVTNGLAVDAVLEIVQAMAESTHKTVSDPLVRMLSKLARHAEQGGAESRVQADEALRDQVRDLLRGWSLEDPNPEEYGRALHRMVAAAPTVPLRTDVQSAEPLRIVQTALETGVLSFGAWRAVERLVADHQLGLLIDMLEATTEAPSDASRPALQADIAPLWNRVTSPDVVRRLASAEPPDFGTLDRVLSHLGVEGFEPLLDVLAEAKSRISRRGLLDRLARAPAELGPIIVERLAGDRPWYVTRNLLLILDGLPALPEGFSAAAYIAHGDARVRREALKLSLRLPADRERAMLGALRDPDAHTVRRALTGAFEDCPAAALPLITRIAGEPTSTSELRVLAIKVLGRVNNSAARDALLGLVDGGRTWFGRRKLATRTIELLAALMALAASWRSDRRAAELLALAAASKDPDIRNAAANR